MTTTSTKPHQMIGKGCCESLDCVIFHERCRLITRIEDYREAVKEIEGVEGVEGVDGVDGVGNVDGVDG